MADMDCTGLVTTTDFNFLREGLNPAPGRPNCAVII